VQVGGSKVLQKHESLLDALKKKKTLSKVTKKTDLAQSKKTVWLDSSEKTDFLEFTPLEWNLLGIDNLQDNHYIKTGSSEVDSWYCMPAGKENTGPTCCRARIHTHTHSLSIGLSQSLNLSPSRTVTRTYPYSLFIVISNDA
jgi:hypothetical protein